MKNKLFYIFICVFIFFSYPVKSESIKDWENKAKKESELVIHGRWRENTLWKDLYKEFKKDYPYININYERKGTKQNIKSIVTFRQTKKFDMDVFIGFSDYLDILYNGGHLESLNSLPEYTMLKEEHKGIENKWASYSIKAWCSVYHTKKINSKELPNNLTDFLDYVIKTKKIVAVNNKEKVYSSFLSAYSKKEVLDKMDKVFSSKPYKTTSSLSNMFSLLSLGEFDFILYMGLDNVERYKEKGMPIEAHCFKEVPLTVTPVAIIKNSNSKYSAKLFVNWLLSKRGQELIYKIDGRLPVRKDFDEKIYFNKKDKTFLFRSWKTYLEDNDFTDKEWSKRFFNKR